MPFANNDGTRIFWEQDGAGDPLLLIMGLGLTHALWHRTRTALAPHYRLILFDNRGVGQSGRPPGPYSIEQMAADAVAVLDSAAIDSAHVFGISMGGMIAQELALSHPARVRKLILGCTACGGPKAVRAEPAAADMLMNRASMSPEDALKASLPFIYDPSTPRERIEKDLALRRREYPEPEAYAAQLQGILRWESYSRLSRITAPTLVIHGEHDRLVPPGNGALIAENIPGAKLVILSNASHIFPTDQPERSHAEILKFLAE
jgi:3-oxoadipate enol-lactonase